MNIQLNQNYFKYMTTSHIRAAACLIYDHGNVYKRDVSLYDLLGE